MYKSGRPPRSLPRLQGGEGSMQHRDKKMWFWMSDETTAIIESQPGNGLNEKIENMVYEYATKAGDIKSEIKRLEEVKKELEDRIEDLGTIINTLYYVSRDLGEVERWVKELVSKERVYKNNSYRPN